MRHFICAVVNRYSIEANGPIPRPGKVAHPILARFSQYTSTRRINDTEKSDSALSPWTASKSAGRIRMSFENRKRLTLTQERVLF